MNTAKLSLERAKVIPLTIRLDLGGLRYKREILDLLLPRIINRILDLFRPPRGGGADPTSKLSEINAQPTIAVSDKTRIRRPESIHQFI